MTPTTFQTPELRDNLDNIIQAGAYGKKTAFCNAQNTGVLDYINNNLMYLREALEHVSGVPLGTIIPFSGNNALPNGFLLCNGASVARAMYPDLFTVIGTTYGAVDSEHFNLPDLRDKFIEGADVGGTVKEAGLPNIDGTFGINGDTNGAPLGVKQGATKGAFYAGGVSAVYSTNVNWDNTSPNTVGFNASRSNPIYGKSTTVQPPALTMRYIIKAFDGQTEDSALIDVTQYENELNNKLDKSGGTMTGNIRLAYGKALMSADTSYWVNVLGGSGWMQGAALAVYGKDHPTMPGEFFLDATKSETESWRLSGAPNGVLSWGGNLVATTNKLSMPSEGSYIDIAVDGTGFGFTAPTDGWVCLIGHQMAQNGSINASLPNGVFVRYDAINGYATVFYPLAKGGYTSAQIISGFFQLARFIYAQSAL